MTCLHRHGVLLEPPRLKVQELEIPCQHHHEFVLEVLERVIEVIENDLDLINTNF